MSDLTIANQLLQYGLTEPESKIYVFMAKRGPSPAGEIAKALKIQRGQTYNVLKALQRKGIVEAIASKPTRFSAISLPKALNVLIHAHKQRQRLMEKIRPELVSMWQSVVSTPTGEVQEEKFQFLKGIESIYRKVIETIEACEKNVRMVASEPALYHADRFGVIEQMKKASRRNVEVEVLAEVTPRIRDIIESMGGINTRNFNDGLTPHFLIIDKNQIVFLTKPLESAELGEATAIWTNSYMLVGTMQRFFENMWSSSKAVSEALAIVQPMKKVAPGRVETELIKALQEEFSKYLSALGFEVRKDYVITGESGTEHVFSLALFQEDTKPTVIDVESSSEGGASMQVARFFAKKLDVEDSIADGTLVLKPGLDENARKLAALYRIKVTELSSEKYAKDLVVAICRIYLLCMPKWNSDQIT